MGQKAERKVFRCTETSKTITTKNMRQTKQEKTLPETLILT